MIVYTVSRLYGSELETGRLIIWLNRRKKTKDRDRVVRLIADIQRLTEYFDPKRGHTVREWNDTFKRICKELGRHRVFPQLGMSVDGRWVASWWSSNIRASRPFPFSFRILGRVPVKPVTVADAIIEVVKVATGGFIDRVRQCRRCAEWFSARLKTQVFCSKECQGKHYWSSPSWKAHRRDYMRRYRQIKSLPNVK